MTRSTTPPTILLSDKLMTINNLSTRVPVVLYVDEINYASWTYFYQNLVHGYHLLDHIISNPTDAAPFKKNPTDAAESSSKSPPKDEWIALDTVMLSWIISIHLKTYNNDWWSKTLKRRRKHGIFFL